MRRFAVAAAMLSLFACQVDTDRVGTVDQPILGGDSLTSNDAVCAMYIVLPDDDEGEPQDPIYCTGAHVAPGVVLTSAACVEDNLVADTLDDIDLRFGASYSDGETFAVADVIIHRYYDSDADSQHNLALLLLDATPTASVVTLSEREITEADIPATDECGSFDTGFTPEAAGCVTLIGYGETGDDAGGFGAQRRTVVPLTSLDPLNIFASDVAKQTCLGDSGGPAFMDFGDGPVMVAVTARWGSCFGNVQRTRVDVHLTDFIYPYLDRFGDTCGLDGSTCDTGCPRTPDPDCDDCSWNDVCEEDCPTRDWDCALGSFVGDECSKDGDCESGGRCVVAADEAAFTFCSLPCDPADAGSCPNNMNCDTGDSAGECVWNTPSPGSQGFACNLNLDCRSGICEETICVNECEMGGTPCPDPYVCSASSVQPGSDVCLGTIYSGGGGFCTPSSVAMRRNQSSPWGGLAMLMMAVAGVFFASRRRRS